MDSLTSTTLLEGLRDAGNSTAWKRFMERYEAMIVSFAKKLGLDDADAHDAAQETLLAFVERYRNKEFDRSKGRLRSWLFGVANHKVVDIHRRRGKERVLSDRSEATQFLNAIEAPEEAEKIWEQEWQHGVLRACLAQIANRVEPNTIRAFKLAVLQQWPTRKVAAHLGMEENAVYIAKHRVMTRIREMREQMEEVW